MRGAKETIGDQSWNVRPGVNHGAAALLVAPAEFGTFAGCGRLIDEALGIVRPETVHITLDCGNIVEANAVFGAALVMLGRKLRERSVRCRLVGLNARSMHVIELHRLEPVLMACGVSIGGSGDDPPPTEAMRAA